jgi:hypothetical protein
VNTLDKVEAGAANGGVEHILGRNVEVIKEER